MKIFRKKRMRLIKEGKLREYFLYSIGEVTLLVVGILIAMKVNNINAKSKTDDQVHATLIALQKDLRQNISGAHSLLAWNDLRDSIITEVLEKRVTRDMYRQGKVGSLHTSYNNAPIIEENLDRLLQYEDHLGTEYSKLLKDLKIYSSNINGEKDVNKLFSDYALEQGRHLTYNHSWFYDFMTGNPNEEAIDYFMTDSFYFNRLAFYNILMVKNQSSFVAGRRNHEAILIARIEEVLNPKKPKKLSQILEANGWVSCKAISCGDSITQDTSFLSFTRPIIVNNMEDTIFLVSKNTKGEEIGTLTLAPDESINRRLPNEGILERIENKKCVERFQTLPNNYLIFN